MSTNKKLKTSKSKGNQVQKGMSPKTAPVSVNKATRINSFLNTYTGPVLPGNWKINAGIFLLMVIATVVFYSGDLHLGFFSIDDEGYVTKNPWITKISFENLSYIFTKPYFSNFSPVHLLSYMMDYSIAGLNAFAFHLSSNMWAGLVAGFVFLVALAVTGRHIIAIPAAILFIVHPSHVEAVAWISSRKDLVATAFALPSLLAYFKYRKGGPSSKKWYLISLLLFFLAVAGKVSVAVFPAIFLAFDLFVEKRPFNKSIVDKIPYLLSAAIISLVVYSAQPLSGNAPDPYVFSAAFGQSLWLLSGFGKYVIFRLRPESGTLILEIVSTLFLLAVFTAPLLLRKKFPIVMALIYWILLGWLPAQLLSFVHPVSDRYLFFPSVAFVILITWGVITIVEKYTRRGVVLAMSLLLLISILWSMGTLKYLSEWRDAKSVWYASLQKSSDPDIVYNLGAYYLNVAGTLGSNPRGTPYSIEEAKKIASAIWAENPKLPDLLSEWDAGKKGGPIEKQFQNYLWTLASQKFDQALQTIGNHVFPLLFFRRGVLNLDRGDLTVAKKEFHAALDEVALSSVEDTRKEITVSSHNALGVIAMKEGNYREALEWYKKAEEEQNRFGGSWIPDISTKRQRMENAVAMLSGTANKTVDPEIAYTMGLNYKDAADQLGNAPRQKFSKEKLVPLAKDIWQENKQLPELLSEWERGQHAGPAETAFKGYLRKLAWDSFESSLRAKDTLVMPNLYFRRGMMLGESGDLLGARKEFLAAIDEASKDNNLNLQQEITVVSHDALGVLAMTSRDYKDALHWFKMAEEEQIRFGSNWVPDLTSKRQRMEEMVKSVSGK